jgi:hypothetical protein
LKDSPAKRRGSRDDIMCAMEHSLHIAGLGACGQEQELVARAHPVGRATLRAGAAVSARRRTFRCGTPGRPACSRFRYGLIDELWQPFRAREQQIRPATRTSKVRMYCVHQPVTLPAWQTAAYHAPSRPHGFRQSARSLSARRISGAGSPWRACNSQHRHRALNRAADSWSGTPACMCVRSIGLSEWC